MSLKKIINYFQSNKNIFNNRGALVDKGAIYVVVILTLLIFGGYIFVGGTLPTKLPKMSTELVNVVLPSNEPTKSSLQMQTFYAITATPYPTSRPVPTSSNDDPRLIDCARDITGTAEHQMIWGITFNSTPASDNQDAIKVFYTNKDSLLLGAGGITQMAAHPADKAVNLSIGDATVKDGNGFPIHPALFITDVTSRPRDVGGDSQAGGQANKPDTIFGTWKAQDAANPQENGGDLGQGADGIPAANGPAGIRDENFKSELIWKISSLRAFDASTFAALQPGHTYRVQIVLHDGGAPAAIGVACVELRLPGTLPTPTSGPSNGERGRVHIANNIVLSDRNTPLRGATIGIVGDAGRSGDAAYWQYLNNLGLNAVRLGVKLSQANRTLDQQLPLIDKAVDLAGQSHMYVMINNSVQPGAYDLAELKTFWSTVAARYKDRTHVFYEMTNEPVGWWPHAYTAQNMADLKSVYDIMRAGAPDTHLVLYDFPNLVPDDPASIVAKIASVPGIDWTKASVGFHHYVDKTNSIEQTINAVKAQYPLIMTETNYWVNDPPSQATTVSTLQIEERLGIGWFSLDGKGSADHLENEIIPNLRAAGFNWTVEN